MIKLIFECEMGELWATAEQFAEMTDADIEELAREDIIEALNGAKVRIIRGPEVLKAMADALYRDRTK